MWSEAMSSLAKMYPKLSAVELSAILMKGAAMSASLERDSGFNSGSSEHEDDLKSLDQSSRDGLISPENSSEDSVEVKLLSSSPSATVTTATTTTSATPSLLSAPQSVAVALVKNKRKSSEPLRVVAETELLAPLKKRIRYDHTKHHQDEAQAPVRQTTQDDDEQGELEVDEERSVSRTATSPFRPWAPEAGHTTGGPSVAASFPHPADLLVRHPAVTTLHRPPFSTSPLDQQQPLALVAKKSCTNGVEQSNGITSPPVSSRGSQSPARRISECTSHSEEDGSEMALQRKLQLLHHQHQQHQQQQHHHHPSHHPLEEFVAPHAPPSIDDGRSNDSMTDHEQQQQQQQQHGHAKGHSSSSSSSAIHSRNYKNMTRERRIEANARERTRVHTISAAYEKLRRAIPAYSNAQKLSKLSILRIACSYILTLSRMAGEDYSEDASEPSIADCVAMVTQTIQTEGKIRKKKDE
uniref:Putative transcription factor atonal n=1 Tax=Anopheles triannulatus TaxID=58253 RepID=A0A2M4AB53_9DIPT